MSRLAFGALASWRPSLVHSHSASVCKMSSAPTSAGDPLVQYVVVRRDLGWPAGSVMAQAVHASVAAVWRSRDEAGTLRYCQEADGSQMRTVVLQADNETALTQLAAELEAESIAHVSWKEEPEGIVTAVAAAPYAIGNVKPLFKRFKLFK